MSGMFWIALELSIPEIGFNIMLSLTVKKLNAFKFDGVAESDNTASRDNSPSEILFIMLQQGCQNFNLLTIFLDVFGTTISD